MHTISRLFEAITASPLYHVLKRLFPKHIEASRGNSLAAKPTADGKVQVVMPDIFQSFLKHPPRLNPNYETVRLESEQWTKELCSLSPSMEKKVHLIDFAYFCAIAAPDAPATGYRVMCDWGNWVSLTLFRCAFQPEYRVPPN